MDQIFPCHTCRANTPHRQMPPNGAWGCRGCVPDAPVQVHVVNPYKRRSLFLHWILPILVLGAWAIANQTGHC